MQIYLSCSRGTELQLEFLQYKLHPYKLKLQCLNFKGNIG